MANKYYWLKLQKDFFKRHDIRIIEAMPNGKDYILFYLKLLVESVSHEGELRFSDTIPYSFEMLSTITNTNVDIVRSAVEVFKQLNMLEILEDSTIYMTEVEKMIGFETEWAKKKRAYRDTQRTLSSTCPPIVRQEIEIEKEIEKDINIKSGKNTDIEIIHRIIDYLNEVCGTHYRFTDKNVKLVRARLNEGFSEEDFKAVIDTKYEDWHKKADMRIYLRPQTLFGTKFESYLNQKGVGNGRAERVSCTDEITDAKLETMRRGTDEDKFVSDLFG